MRKHLGLVVGYLTNDVCWPQTRTTSIQRYRQKIEWSRSEQAECPWLVLPNCWRLNLAHLVDGRDCTGEGWQVREGSKEFIIFRRVGDLEMHARTTILYAMLLFMWSCSSFSRNYIQFPGRGPKVPPQAHKTLAFYQSDHLLNRKKGKKLFEGGRVSEQVRRGS